MNQKVGVKTDFECCYISDIGVSPYFSSHRYRIEVSVECPSTFSKLGYVIDFNELKTMLDSVVPRDKFLYSSSSEGNTVSKVESEVSSICEAYGVPSVCIPLKPGGRICAESICQWVVTNLQDVFHNDGRNVSVVEATLRENSNFTVKWERDWYAVAN